MTAETEEHIIITPRRNKSEGAIPENGLLLVNPTEAAQCLRLLEAEGGRKRFLFNSGLVVAAGSAYFAAGPAIGAPMAALTLEKLIALGARRVILFGWCGAISPRLKVGDILVPHLAYSGEGTSGYYLEGSQLASHPLFSSRLRGVLSENGLKVCRDAVWSTDAIYREDRRLLTRLWEDKHVGGVDMEFSALCAVAKFREIEFGAVLTVSDELWGSGWRPGFSKEIFKERKEKALQLLLENMTDIGGSR